MVVDGFKVDSKLGSTAANHCPAHCSTCESNVYSLVKAMASKSHLSIFTASLLKPTIECSSDEATYTAL